ncbi:DUF3168 domain-containing protein, partial [Herbaspirillum sp.]|uniref:DUF3168 domain-containing protein n=1 Tax=Herbaspirillum sp. TaxID=1890675 RepID=UPI00258F1A4D
DSFPYVVLGEDIANPFDTDDTLGADVLATLHVWSRYAGRKEAKAILAEIYDELHRDKLPAQSGFAFVDCLQEFASVFPPEADGRTRHAMCRYRVTVQKE